MILANVGMLLGNGYLDLMEVAPRLRHETQKPTWLVTADAASEDSSTSILGGG